MNIILTVITYLIVNQPTTAILLDMHDHPGLERKYEFYKRIISL